MLKKLIICSNVGISVGQFVSGKMNLGQPQQIDCTDEGHIKCDNGEFCGVWQCENEGPEGHEQTICQGLCPLGNLSGERKCSCTKMFGPIQIIAPCEWEITENPSCSPSDMPLYTTTTIMPTTIRPTSGLVTTRSLRPSAPREIPAMPSSSHTVTGDRSRPGGSFDFQDFGRMLLGDLMPQNMGIPQNIPQITAQAQAPVMMPQAPQAPPMMQHHQTRPPPNPAQNTHNTHRHSNTESIGMDPRELYNKVGRRKEDKVCETRLPQHNQWRCNHDDMVKGTICKYRCNKKTFLQKCVCSRNGKCDWRKQSMPKCLLEMTTTTTTTTTTVTTTTTTEEPTTTTTYKTTTGTTTGTTTATTSATTTVVKRRRRPRPRPNMANDVSRVNQFHNARSRVSEQPEVEETVDLEFTTVEESQVRTSSSSNPFSHVFNFMSHIMEANNRMYDKMLSMVEKIIDKVN